MTITHSRTFRSGNSEAVRLPKDVAFGADMDVTIIRSGDVLTIYPKRQQDIPGLVARLKAMPRPEAVEIRDTDEIPERDGL